MKPKTQKTLNTPHALWRIAFLSAALGMCALPAGCATDQSALMRFLASSKNCMHGTTEYRIMPPDVLVITATPTEEYNNRLVRVGPDGKAFLPLVGVFKLANKSTSQIAAELTENLHDYYEDVQVTVTVAEYASQKYYVLGEVSHPGVFPFTGNDNFISAVAAASPTRLAWPERIYVVRGLNPLPGEQPVRMDAKGKLNTGAKLQRIRVNLMEMAKDGELSGNVTLAENDVIYVPANPFAKVGLAIQDLLLPASPAVSAAGFPYQLKDSATGTGTYYGNGNMMMPR